jgi:hypothetical protein
MFSVISSTVASGRDSRAGDDQRNPDIGVEGCHLAGHEAMLAHVVAVIRAEHEIGVVLFVDRGHGCLQFPDHRIDGEHRLGAFSEIPVDAGHIRRRQGPPCL